MDNHTDNNNVVEAFHCYLGHLSPVWCPGCGDYSVLGAFMEAAGRLHLPTHQIAMVSGIGCSSRFPFFVKAYGFHGVHGRALPIATGVKMANPELTVVVPGGDGDGLAIGGGHLPHVARNNPDITYLLFNNSIYGLTKGQSSPTSPSHFPTKTSPYGILGEAVNPAALALAYGASFVARGVAVKREHLVSLIEQGLRHKGFSFIEIITSCSSFSTKHLTITKVLQRMVELEKCPEDDLEALRLASDTRRIYLGVFRRVERPTLSDQAAKAQQVSQKGKPVTVPELLQQFA
ncbi:MAG: 2-oxoacid:ferredoxin oxidoreductase subunit beta [Acidobacteria bacterium]|nr:2-oxoacid:ferredoxin oxidoreductase subunit beta [Acidobacteriota bacterium]